MKPNTALSLFIFLFISSTHFLSGTTTVTDSRWVLPTAISVTRTHNTNLNEYGVEMLADKDKLGIEKIDSNYYYFFPIGTPLLVTPFVGILDFTALNLLHKDISNSISKYTADRIEVFLASLVVALAAVFVFLFSLQITNSKWLSLLLVFIFAFCTPAWSTASRALWSHGPSMLFLSITLYCLLKSSAENNAYLFFAGMALAYSYVIRPTNSLSVILLSGYIVYKYRLHALSFIFGALLIAIPFVTYNFSVYHNILSSYYMPGRVGGNEHLAEGLVGNLFSPNRGLFIFSPVLILSIAGIALKVWRKTFNVLDACILSIILLHYYIISSISTLYGGWCFGPRLFTDVLPFFLYFLAYFIHGIPDIRQALLHKFTVACICILICTSFFIHYRGATRPATFMWNGIPNNIDEHADRIWQWSDLQFLR